MRRLFRHKLICCLVLLIAATLILTGYVIHKPQEDRIQDVPYLHDFHGVKLQEARYLTESPNRTKVWCLLTQPFIQRHEIRSKSGFTNNGYYCGEGNKDIKVDVDFNIERTFTFGFAEREGDIAIPLTTDGTRMGSQTDKKRIPKKFHFIWSDSKIPSNFVGNLKRFYELHPAWEFNFWTLKYGRTLIKKLEPKLIPAFDNYAKDVSRADVLRYVLMYHIGGAYFDLDSYPRMPLDNLTMVEDCIVGAEPLELAVFCALSRSVLSNAGFLCKPKHAFFRHALDTIPKQSHVRDILKATGPFFFSNCFNSYIHKQIFNKQNPDISESINIAVVRHEYFEFLLHKYVNVTEKCMKVLPRVDAFAPYCLGPRQDVTKCEEAHHGLSSSDILTFEACLEWTRHGREKRNLGNPIRYVDHLHIGVHNSDKFLVYTKENNMSEIVPGSIVHL